MWYLLLLSLVNIGIFSSEERIQLTEPYREYENQNNDIDISTPKGMLEDRHSARYSYSTSEFIFQPISLSNQQTLQPLNNSSSTKYDIIYLLNLNQVKIGTCTFYNSEERDDDDKDMKQFVYWPDTSNARKRELRAKKNITFDLTFDNKEAFIKQGMRYNESLLVNLLFTIARDAASMDPKCSELVYKGTIDLEELFSLPHQQNFNRLPHFSGYSSLSSVFYKTSCIMEQIGINIRFYHQCNNTITMQSVRKYWLFTDNVSIRGPGSCRKKLKRTAPENDFESKRNGEKTQKIASIIQRLEKNKFILSQNGEILGVEKNYYARLKNAKAYLQSLSSSWYGARFGICGGLLCMTKSITLLTSTTIDPITKASAILSSLMVLAAGIASKHRYDNAYRTYKELKNKNRTPYHRDGKTAAVQSYLQHIKQEYNFHDNFIKYIGDNDGLVVKHYANIICPLCITMNTCEYDLPAKIRNELNGRKPIFIPAAPRPIPWNYDNE